ncbi:MAG: heparan-alpha-glucosaminide N-acetyltransferase domain-containing protein [Acidobacteriota bacterium]|nr:heparan-alpha-glucosaminide N-acetyltransferase domain-containing protein [Acidobacteriota bacterium]
MAVHTSQSVAGPARILSVDVLRGLTIAFMILVNTPGDSTHTFTPLEHAEWNGWTPTDLVFPNFLFLIGMSLIFSLQSRIGRGDNRLALAAHIIRRAAILFALDIFIAAFPHFHFAGLRIYGVLTRIAVCYLIAALLLLVTRRVAVLTAIVVALLVGYWALLRFVPVPGYGVPTRDVAMLDMTGNLTSWIDREVSGFLMRTIHVGSLYRGTRDPEGLLSTMTAVATMLLGSIAAVLMRSLKYTTAAKRNAFAAAGVLCVIAGEVWNRSFPINKNMWTSSYVLLAGGISLLSLALVYWLVDMEKLQDRSSVVRAVLWPWLVFGSNAIVVYVVSELLVDVLVSIRFSSAGKMTNAMAWLYTQGFSHGRSTEVTSVAFALAFVAVCFVPNWMLWRKRIFVKI